MKKHINTMRALIFISICTALLTRPVQAQEGDDNTSRSGLLQKCCEMPVRFLNNAGNETIFYGSTNEAFRLRGEFDGDISTCEARWSHKTPCEERFEDVTVQANQENGDQKDHLANRWGPVVYRTRFNCQGNAFDCNDGTVLPVVDWGFWFFNKKGEMKKFRRNGFEIFDREFYDARKKTIIFIHGARQGSSENDIRQDFILNIPKLDSEGNPILDADGEPEVEPDSLYTHWIERGYNFGIFNWSQFADEPSLSEIEQKLWDPNAVNWRDPAGNEVTEALPEEKKSLVDMMKDSYQVWSPPSTGGSVTIVGHGLGAQLAFELAEHMKQRNRVGIIEKVVFLNGWWSDIYREYVIGEDTVTAQRRSLNVARSLYATAEEQNEGKPQIRMEGYRNVAFDRNEFPEGSAPAYVGQDNDSLKAVSAFSQMETIWSNHLIIPGGLNNLFAGERLNHESLYLWYLKSIDYDERGKLVDSVVPEVNGQPLKDRTCGDWGRFIGNSFTAAASRSEVEFRQEGRNFFTQIAGELTMEAADDSLVAENFCLCELKKLEEPKDAGLLPVHAAAIKEFAHCNDLAIFLRTPEKKTWEWVTQMYNAKTRFPSPLYTLPTIGDNDPCGDIAGLSTVNPNIQRVRSIIGPPIEYENDPLTLSGDYRRYMFDSVAANSLYTYPMAYFKDERWNETFTQALIHKKLDRNWKISVFQPDCYLVRDSLGNSLFNSYRLHGAYVEATGEYWGNDADRIGALNENINNRAEDYAFFDFQDAVVTYGLDGVKRFDMVQSKFTHDSWEQRNDWYLLGAETGPQGRLTVFSKNGFFYELPEGDVPAQKEMYECLGIDWQALYPDEFDSEDPDKVVYYAATEDEIPDESTNLGGYPVLHASETDPGRPTEGQRSYEFSDGTPGAHNYFGQRKLDRSPLLQKLMAFRNNASNEFSWRNFALGQSFTRLTSEPVGMHEHHYTQMGQFALEFQTILANRNSNSAALKWIDEMYRGGKYRPKPFAIKGKSLQAKAYQDLPLIDTHNEPGFEDGARIVPGESAPSGTIKFIGPGKAIIDDDKAALLDINCAEQAGLASYDPRTVRGRGLVDPPRDFDRISEPCEHTDFEEKYATSLQTKMLNGGYYVFPIPFFANKYQQFFRFESVTSLDENGTVSAVVDGRPLVYTDQSARVIELRLSWGGQPLQFDPDQGFYSAISPSSWTASELDEALSTGSTTDLELEQITFEAYHDPTSIHELGTPDRRLWTKTILNMRPVHTTYPTAYEAYDAQSPVWLRGTGHPISFPADFDEDENPAFYWIGFRKSDGTTLFNRTLDDNGNLQGAGAPPTDWGDPQIDVVTGEGFDAWDNKSWVEVYYEIVKKYYYDKTQSISHDPVSEWQNNPIWLHTCYTVKDQEGNNYYSDYDMHGYYYSEVHPEERKRGSRWWKSYLIDANPQLPRQVFNHYLNQGLNIQNDSIRDLYNTGVDVEGIIRDDRHLTDAPDSVLQKSFPYDLIQHGPHDDWVDRNNYGAAEINAGPQSNLTIWVPLDENNGTIYTLTDQTPTIVQETLYKYLGITWESIYPQANYTINTAEGHAKGTSIMQVAKKSDDEDKPCIYWSDQNHGCEYDWTTAGIEGALEDVFAQIKQFKNYFKAHKVLPGLAPDGTSLDPTLTVNLGTINASRALAALVANTNNCISPGFPLGEEPGNIKWRLDLGSGEDGAYILTDVRVQAAGTGSPPRSYLEEYKTTYSEVGFSESYPPQPIQLSSRKRATLGGGLVEYQQVGGVDFTNLDAAFVQERITGPDSYDVITIANPKMVASNDPIPALDQVWKYLKKGQGDLRISILSGDWQNGVPPVLNNEEACFFGKLNAFYDDVVIEQEVTIPTYFDYPPPRFLPGGFYISGEAKVVPGEPNCNLMASIESDGTVTLARQLPEDIIETLADVDLEKGVYVYPNPAQDVVTVRFDEEIIPAVQSFELTDMEGKSIGRGLLKMYVNNSVQLNVENVENGIYLLQINLLGGNHVQRKVLVWR